jgi:hypothetical protein
MKKKVGKKKGHKYHPKKKALALPFALVRRRPQNQKKSGLSRRRLAMLGTQMLTVVIPSRPICQRKITKFQARCVFFTSGRLFLAVDTSSLPPRWGSLRHPPFPHSVSAYAHPQYSARLSAARRGVRPFAARRGVRRPLVARHTLVYVYIDILCAPVTGPRCAYV